MANCTPHEEDCFEAVVWALSVVHGKDGASVMLAHGFSVGKALRALKKVVAMLAQVTLKQQGISYNNNFVVFQTEMAKTRDHAPPKLHGILLAALQCGRFAVYPDRGPVRGFDGINVIFDGGGEPCDKVFMVQVADTQRSKTAAGKPQRRLPARRPQGIRPLEWRVAGAVLDLQNEGVGWNQVPDLLDLVRKRIVPDTASLPTLKNARRYLREKGLLDR
jgi:hypothetical protein